MNVIDLDGTNNHKVDEMEVDEGGIEFGRVNFDKADLEDVSDDEHEPSSQEELISKIQVKLDNLSGPEFMCFRCGVELYQHEVKWKVKESNLQTCAQTFPSKAHMIKEKKGRKKEVRISSCQSCLKEQKYLFHDFGAMPEEISNLENYYEKKVLSLGSLFQTNKIFL